MTTSTIEWISVDSINVGKRLRATCPAVVTTLADSIQRLGLLQPISVCFTGSNHAVLVTGLHRLEAVKRLGWPRIEAVLVTGDDLELQEIAENLHRAELSALERDEQIARWIGLVERKRVQPEQVSVGGRGNKGGEAQASRELGLSRPDVHRAVKVAAMAHEAKEAARETGLDDNRSALLTAAKGKTPSAQVNVIKGIAASKKKKSRKPRMPTAPRTPEQCDELNLEGLQAFWEMAGDNARAAFLKSVRSEPARGVEAICDRTREAITILSGLPPAHEVAGYFAGTDGATIISERLRPAAAWLAEFDDAWPREEPVGGVAQQ